MSRTFNHSRRNFNKYKNNIEYPDGYEQIYDYSHTADSDNSNPRRECTRHPNKRRHTVLDKEFSKFGIYKIKNYRNPYGEVDYKSFRLRLHKRTANEKRRAKLKEETYELINNNEL